MLSAVSSSALAARRSSWAVAARRQRLVRLAVTTTAATTTSQDATSTKLEEASRSSSHLTTLGIALASLSVGFAAGQAYTGNQHHQHQHNHVLPNGLPRACCEDQEKPSATIKLTSEQEELPEKLSKLVGKENVLDGSKSTTTTLPFLKGARLGQGQALCIVTPQRLHLVEPVVQTIVDAGCVVLPQGQNTGLTGGSVPRSNQDDRPVVILSMKHLNRLFPIDDGDRVVCLAGVGLAQLEQFLKQHFPNRESHSQLGSTFLNPTTAAGVAFGSGGMQLRKGPAYTERALYLKVYKNKWNENVVQVVNTLGIDGMETKERLAGRERKFLDSVAYRLDRWSQDIEGGYENTFRYSTESGKKPAAHDATYPARVCDCEHSGVSRFNADTRGPDLNRSEGKVIILATVHDTFAKPKSTKSYWIGFDSLQTALEFRRDVCLDNPTDLPISCEYLNRDAYDVIDTSGRVMANSIYWLGVSSPLVRQLWNVKLWVQALPFSGAQTSVDKIFYFTNNLLPAVLPRPVQETGKAMDHHVMVTVGEFDDGTLQRFLERLDQFVAKKGEQNVKVHDCTAHPSALTAFRFVAAAAFLTWCVGNGAQGVSVDYALPRNDGSEPPLEDDETKKAVIPLKRMRYSHFGCNVVHEDLAYAAGVDTHAAKHDLKHAVELKSGGKLPAEHGHGTEYVAPKATQERWKRMDPLNVCNPGVGGLSYKAKYQE